MTIDISLETLSVAEKVRLLELVWQSLCSHSGDVRSPEWHHEVLEARKQRLDDGKAAVAPWNEAKVRLLRVGQ
jgi:putative addiction module component (TIGR02574 family)